MRISDWSSDVCSSDLSGLWTTRLVKIDLNSITKVERKPYSKFFINNSVYNLHQKGRVKFYAGGKDAVWLTDRRSEEHTSELQSLMRISYAVFCLKNNNKLALFDMMDIHYI